jgi:hypothetical protein
VDVCVIFSLPRALSVPVLLGEHPEKTGYPIGQNYHRDKQQQVHPSPPVFILSSGGKAPVKRFVGDCREYLSNGSNLSPLRKSGTRTGRSFEIDAMTGKVTENGLRIYRIGGDWGAGRRKMSGKQGV